MSKKKWTEEELELLKKEAPSHTLGELKKKFLPQFTSRQIRHRVESLGLFYKRTKNSWSQEEEELLKEHVDSLTPKELHAKYFPNRTVPSLRSKIKLLGLVPCPPQGPWSQDEIDIMYEHAPKSSVRELMGLLPEKSAHAIRNFADRYGVELLNRSGTKQRIVWHDEDLQILIDNYLTLDTKEISPLLRIKRGEKAIVNKANDLGLYKREVRANVDRTEAWTKEEEVYLKRYYKEKTAPEISKALGRSAGAIYRKAQDLNVCKYRRPNTKRYWTEEEDIHLHAYIGERSCWELAKELNRTERSIRKRLHKIGLSTRVRDYTWKDLDKLFNGKEKLLKKKDFYEAIQLGLVHKTYHKKSKKFRLKPINIRNFMKIRPEFINVYELPEETLVELNIDLDTWPEPPIYKLKYCNGWKRSEHSLRLVRTDLYDRHFFCPFCGKKLNSWADSYTSREDLGQERSPS